MATKKKRTSTRSTTLVGRAVTAGRRALKEAESRIPPDLRRQLDRRLKDADRAARAAIKQLEAQVKKASTRADVNSVLKRIDGLTKQARQIVRVRTARPAPARRRAAATGTRKAAPSTRRRSAAAAQTRRRAAATTARRPATTRRAPATTRRAAAPTRRAAPRRRARPAGAVIADVTETIIPLEDGEIDVLEVTES